HEGPAEVVDAPGQRFGRGLEAHLDPARLHVPVCFAHGEAEHGSVFEVLLVAYLLEAVGAAEERWEGVEGKGNEVGYPTGALGQPQPAEIILERPVRMDARLDAELRRAVLDGPPDAPHEFCLVMLVGVRAPLALPEPAERTPHRANVRHVDVAIDDERDAV